jgi:hypothetical protein
MDYLHSVHCCGHVDVRLIGSKSVIAPVKQIFTPGLEISCAVLLARLIMAVCCPLLFDIKEVWTWTDSTVVMAWLASHPTIWETFVAN